MSKFNFHWTAFDVSFSNIHYFTLIPICVCFKDVVKRNHTFWWLQTFQTVWFQLLYILHVSFWHSVYQNECSNFTWSYDYLFFVSLDFRRHIGLLRVKGKKMNLQKIPLQTVRQFFIQDVTLSDHPDLFSPEQPNVTLKVQAFCQEKVHRHARITHTRVHRYWLSFIEKSSLSWQRKHFVNNLARKARNCLSQNTEDKKLFWKPLFCLLEGLNQCVSFVQIMWRT